MRKLIITAFAGLFVLALAAVSMAGESYHNLGSIDPSGYSAVQVHSPSYPVAVASQNLIYLDSGGKWAVADIRTTSSTSTASVSKGMEQNSKAYCFDSGARFCAKAF